MQTICAWRSPRSWHHHLNPPMRLGDCPHVFPSRHDGACQCFSFNVCPSTFTHLFSIIACWISSNFSCFDIVYNNIFLNVFLNMHDRQVWLVWWRVLRRLTSVGRCEGCRSAPERRPNWPCSPRGVWLRLFGGIVPPSRVAP